MKTAYLASGWFTEEQEKARMEIFRSLQGSGMLFYSPKNDGQYIPGESSENAIFAENIVQIESCDFMIASTVGKDMGTLFECGVAFHCSKPIVYYWPNPIGKFNLMLSQSSVAVFHTEIALYEYLLEVRLTGKLECRPYGGDIE